MANLNEIIKQERLKKNLTLDDVSKSTKIRISVLKAIEDGNFLALNPVYMKSFIKEYIKFLDINDNEIKEVLTETFKKIDKELNQQSKQSSSKQIQFREGDRAIKHIPMQLHKASIFIYVALFLAVITFVYFLFFYSPPEPPPPEQITFGKVDTLTVSMNKGLAKDVFTFSPDSITLEFVATDTSWINMVVDNVRSENVILYPGNIKVWRAANFFRFTLGNAGGVQIKRNDEMLPPLGRKGVVVKGVTITRDKIYISGGLKQQDTRKDNERKPTEILELSRPRIILPDLREKKDTSNR